MRISDWSSDVCSSDLQSTDNTGSARRFGIRGIPQRTLFRSSLAPAVGDVVHAARNKGGLGGITGRRGNVIATLDRVRFNATAVLLSVDLGLGVCDVRIRLDLEFRSEEHTSELQSLMRISYAVFCL